jgi:RimJ/RimL family protein N-acetyltransferase
MVNLRKFAYDDIDFILKNWVNTDLLNGFFKNDDRESLEKRIDKYNSEKSGEKFLFTYCIEFNGCPVGLLQFTEKYENTPNLNIYIEESKQKQGIGTKAFDTAKNIAKDKGFSCITSSCAKDNFKSVHFHNRVGFKLIKEELSPNGTPMLRWIYELI